MTLLKQILVVFNALVLPFFYTSIKQIIHQNQQYGTDLQNLANQNQDTAILNTGVSYQSQKMILFYLTIVLVIIFCQFVYLQYVINFSFRMDKNWMLGIAVLCLILASALPTLLLFSYFYKPEFIGHLLLNKNINSDNKILAF